MQAVLRRPGMGRQTLAGGKLDRHDAREPVGGLQLTQQRLDLSQGGDDGWTELRITDASDRLLARLRSSVERTAKVTLLAGAPAENKCRFSVYALTVSKTSAAGASTRSTSGNSMPSAPTSCTDSE